MNTETERQGFEARYAPRLSGALFGFCGAAGAGKDTAAAMLPGALTLAFADVLYAEVAAAFGVTVARLKLRDLKETEQECFALEFCKYQTFADFICSNCCTHERGLPRSPRQILQWWGDYRRSQDPDYFVKRVQDNLLMVDAVDKRCVVLTDCRFANEVAMLRAMGGKLVQVVRPAVVAGGTGHASDTDGSQFAPDYVLHNSGSLEDLRRAVAAMARLPQAAAPQPPEAAPVQMPEPVAAVGDTFSLLWIGAGPIAPLCKKWGITVGTKLYTEQQVLEMLAKK